MYLDFYHLKRKPFHVTPDPEFLYLSPSHGEALASIVYGVGQRKGIIEVTGEVGTGKTTILRSYLKQADPERVKAAYVFNPNVSFPFLLKNIFRELGIDPISTEVHEMIVQFHLFLIDEYTKDHTVILVIDEAQNIPVKTLEDMRLLSNVETTTEKLLQIILCGQSELDIHLGRKELRQFKQRVAVRATISSLSRKESLEYIRHRLSKASSDGTEIFTAAALERIVRKANGYPRVINILCDNALVTGYGYQEKKISSRTAREIIVDLEGKSSQKYQRWRVAGLSFLLFLIVGYWIYTTNAFTFQGLKTTKISTPASPRQPPNNPGVFLLGSPVSPASKQDNVSPVPGRLQEEKIKTIGEGVKQNPVVSQVESPVAPAAERKSISPVPSGLPGKRKKPAGERVKQKSKPVTRVVRKEDNTSPLAEEISKFSDQVVLNRVKQQNRGIKDQNVILPERKNVIQAR